MVVRRRSQRGQSRLRSSRNCACSSFGCQIRKIEQAQLELNQFYGLRVVHAIDFEGRFTTPEDIATQVLGAVG